MVGGGATGVELAGALAELRALDDAFPEVDRADVRIRLVEMAPALLAPFHPRLQGYALAELRRRGVDVHLDTQIKEITDDRVILANGEELPSDVTVWAAGVSAPADVGGWGLPQGRGGRIEVTPDLRVAGQDRIFATGDIALIEGQPLPQVAQPAIQTGRHAGKQIALLMAGRPTQPFRYHDKGIMATIGRRSAVVELAHGARIHGTLAWLAWLGLHLFYLLGGRNRLSALLNLSYRYLVWGHGGGVIVGDDPPRPSRAARRRRSRGSRQVPVKAPREGCLTRTHARSRREAVPVRAAAPRACLPARAGRGGAAGAAAGARRRRGRDRRGRGREPGAPAPVDAVGHPGSGQPAVPARAGGRGRRTVGVGHRVHLRDDRHRHRPGRRWRGEGPGRRVRRHDRAAPQAR